MLELSLHALDIGRNSIEAGAKSIVIEVTTDTRNDTVAFQISDDGPGIPGDLLNTISDPFITTKSGKRVGLGFSLFKEAAHRCGGDFSVESQPGSGTVVQASFKRNHIDLQPMGDLAGTVMALLSEGSRDLILRYSIDGVCEVIRGRVPPDLIRSISSLPSSRMVRSVGERKALNHRFPVRAS